MSNRCCRPLGNMRVLLWSREGRPLITLGPDWRYFIPMFSGITLFGAINLTVAFLWGAYLWVAILGICIYSVGLSSWLVTALADPGIITREGDDEKTVSLIEKTNICRLCKAHPTESSEH